MPKKPQNAKKTASNGANVGYEAQLSQMADALSGIDSLIAQGGAFHNNRHPSR